MLRQWHGMRVFPWLKAQMQLPIRQNRLTQDHSTQVMAGFSADGLSADCVTRPVFTRLRFIVPR